MHPVGVVGVGDATALRGDVAEQHVGAGCQRGVERGLVALLEVFELTQLVDLGDLRLVDGTVGVLVRRNLLVSGAELNELVGQEFELQDIRLTGVEECRPCYWMNTAISPGAEDWLRGRGGLRCRILTSGWLRTRVEALC